MMVWDQILMQEAQAWALDNPDQVDAVTKAIEDPLTLLPGYSDFKAQAAGLGNALAAISENGGVFAVGILIFLVGGGLIAMSWGENLANAADKIASKLPALPVP